MMSLYKYSGDADKSRMVALAREFQAENLHVIDLPYRLSSWALDDPDNVGLWVDENDQLIAWAVMQIPFWTIDYVFNPDADATLHKEILMWADQRAHALISTPYGHPSWFVNVFADQTERRQELEQFGYVSQAEAGEDSWSKVWMKRSGQLDVPSYPVPTGFTLRRLAGASEVEDYVELHQAIFETKNMNMEWRLRTLRQPDYKPELDVVVAALDGRLAAFCIGWIYPNNDGGYLGQIEPLGSHPYFRKHGLGRVALCEMLRRLQQHGVESIYVETDNYRDAAFRLYVSVGFRVIREVLVYRKDYNDTTGLGNAFLNLQKKWFSYEGVNNMAIDWEAWKFLLGEWEGEHEGDPGQGYGRFSFDFNLDENILVRRSRTIFPTAKEREGYTHDDLLIIYTEFTGVKRAIYFDNEEHVIHYEVSISPDQKMISLESDPVPSAPQFRFTYIKTGEDTLEARFEMAPPGAPGAFTVYLEGTSRRISSK